jgi:hypothetical protein
LIAAHASAINQPIMATAQAPRKTAVKKSCRQLLAPTTELAATGLVSALLFMLLLPS